MSRNNIIIFFAGISGFGFSSHPFPFQYNRRAWSADEMAIPSILRDMGPNDIEAK